MPKHYKQKPLQQLHHTRNAQVLNTRERVRAAVRFDNPVSPFAHSPDLSEPISPYVGFDSGAYDRTAVMSRGGYAPGDVAVFDSMAMAMESLPRAEGADYAEIERRIMEGIVGPSRGEPPITRAAQASASMLDTARRIAANFQAEFPSLTEGLESLRALINSAPAPRMHLPRADRRRFASGGVLNYPIQAAQAAALEAAILRNPTFFVSAEDAEQFSLDAVRSVYRDIAKTRLKGQKPHPDTGKVLPPPPRRLARSAVGVMVEEVRNADGTVSRRPKAPARE